MKRVGRNLAALLASQVATWAFTLLMVTVLPDVLGDSQYGVFAFASSFVAFFALAANWGVGPYLTRAIARDEASAGRYLRQALLTKAPLLIVLLAAALTLIHALGQPVQSQQLVAIYGAGMVLTCVNAVCVATLQGEQRMTKTAFWATLGQYLANTAMLAVVLLGGGVLMLAGVAVASGVAPLIANLWQVAPRLRGPWTIDRPLLRALMLGGLPFLIWDLAFSIYASVDVTMLSLLTNSATVAWYSVAYKLVGIPVFLPSLVVTAVFPALAVGGLSITPSFVALANRALRWVFYLMAPVAVGTALLAENVVHFLHYPAGFEHSVLLIRILAVHIPIVGLTMLLGMVLTAADRQRQWVTVACLAALINPALNLAAIPLTSRVYGDGAIGAAIVTVITECCMLAGALRLRPAGVLDGATAAYLLRCIAASALMAGPVLLLRGAFLPLPVAAGAATYLACSLLLGALTPQDLRRGKEYLALLAPLRLRRATGATYT